MTNRDGARYPLARLAELRALRATGAAIDLAEALAGEAEAEREVADAGGAVEQARAAARGAAVLAGEKPARVWEIARNDAYAIRLRREVQRAEVRLRECERELAEWRETVASAREQATAARGEQRVVEMHRERWEEAVKKKRERRED